MQLKAGKFYKTRNGDKVYCIGKNELSDKIDNIAVAVNDEDIEMYDEQGHYMPICKNTHKVSAMDIVDVWKDNAEDEEDDGIDFEEEQEAELRGNKL